MWGCPKIAMKCPGQMKSALWTCFNFHICMFRLRSFHVPSLSVVLSTFRLRSIYVPSLLCLRSDYIMPMVPFALNVGFLKYFHIEWPIAIQCIGSISSIINTFIIIFTTLASRSPVQSSSLSSWPLCCLCFTLGWPCISHTMFLPRTKWAPSL